MVAKHLRIVDQKVKDDSFRMGSGLLLDHVRWERGTRTTILIHIENSILICDDKEEVEVITK